MDDNKVKIYSGGIYTGDISKFVPLHRGEVVLTNEQAAKLLATIKK